MKHISIDLAPSLEQAVQLKESNATAAMKDILMVQALACGQSTDISWVRRVILNQGLPVQDDIRTMCLVTGARLVISAHHVQGEEGVVKVHVEIKSPGGSSVDFKMIYRDGHRALTVRREVSRDVEQVH